MSTLTDPTDSFSSAQFASRVSEYWAKQSEKARASRSVWLNNEIVASHIYSLISGGRVEHWLGWLMLHYFAGKTFENSLSICCGDGAHEIALYQTGKVRCVHGFDISEGAIINAIKRFQDASVPPDRYHFEICDANNLKLHQTFDLIISSGALHHITSLENVLSELAGALASGGYLVIVEYVGPNRFQWTDKQLAVLNGILRQIDLRYLNQKNRVKVGRPPLDEFIAIDPSEAVRSEQILPLLQQYFTIEYLKKFNGTILHPLYPLLNSDLTNSASADFDTIIRLILFFEDFLVREELLPSDFAFAICRPKGFCKPEDWHGALTVEADQMIGFVDTFDSNGISGWAANILQPSMPVEVDIYLDEYFQATVRCDVFRQDLVDAGYGDGRKGFNYALSDPITYMRAEVKLVAHGLGKILAVRRRNLAR